MPDPHFYGYPVDQDDLERPVNLREVTLCVSPSALREIAQFILASADELEQLGTKFGHRHIQDWSKSWPIDSPDLIVYNPSA